MNVIYVPYIYTIDTRIMFSYAYIYTYILVRPIAMFAICAMEEYVINSTDTRQFNDDYIDVFSKDIHYIYLCLN